MKTRDEMLDEIYEFWKKYEKYIESKGDKFSSEYFNIQNNRDIWTIKI